MRPSWKIIGLAGLAGVAATGVVVVRKRRTHQEYDPDELRERLHRRLAETSTGDEGEVRAGPPPNATEASRADATLGRFRAWWSRIARRSAARGR